MKDHHFAPPPRLVTLGTARLAPAFTLALLCIAQTACFSYEEEIWVARDGSGRAHVELHVAPLIMQLASTPTFPNEEEAHDILGSRLQTYHLVQDEDGGIYMTIEYTFGANERFPLGRFGAQLPTPPHELKWKKDAGRIFVFTRNGDIQKVDRGTPLDRLLSPRSTLGLRYDIVVHVPGETMKSNATEVKAGKNGEGDTLIWHLSALDLSGDRPLVAYVRVPLLPPGMLAIALPAILILMLVLIISMLLIILLARRRNIRPATVAE